MKKQLSSTGRQKNSCHAFHFPQRPLTSPLVMSNACNSYWRFATLQNLKKSSDLSLSQGNRHGSGTLLDSVADPDPDPHVFGPHGSGYISQRYGSGSDSGSGSFYHHAKIVRKTLIPTILWLFFDFLSVKNDVNLPLKNNKAFWRSMTKMAGSGFTPKCRGSGTLPEGHIRIWCAGWNDGAGQGADQRCDRGGQQGVQVLHQAAGGSGSPWCSGTHHTFVLYVIVCGSSLVDPNLGTFWPQFRIGFQCGFGSSI